MTAAQPNRPPRFLGQGILILLPVILLAAVGAYSLRSDRRLAEQEIQDRAGWLADRAHATLGTFILNQLDSYLAYRAGLSRDTNELVNAWARSLSLMTNRPAPGEVGLRFPSALDSSESLPRLVGGDAETLWLDGQHLAFAHEYRFPADTPSPAWTGSPSDLPDSGYRPFFGEGSLGQTNEWLFQHARQTEHGSTNIDAVIAAYEAFLDANPPAESGVPARYILGVLELKRGRTNTACVYWEEVRQAPGVWLPDTRVPVRPLALDQLARLRPDEMPPLIFRDLCLAAVKQPSLITPLLLDRAEALLGPGREAERALVNACRGEWALQERTRRFGEVVREHLATLAGTNQWHWWEWKGERFLLTRQFTNEQVPGPNGSQVTNQWSLLGVLPKTAVEWAACRAFSNAWAPLRPPAGLTLELDWDGEPLRLAQAGATPKQTAALPPPLARVHAPVPAPHAVGHEFTVRLYGSDLSALYAPLRLRRQLFSALIFCSAVTALVGFLWTRTAFRRQLQLSEMKTSFVSSVSHELRAPLASVRLMAESLDRGKVPEPAKQRDYFRFIVQECRRLSALIENVLDFARIEQGRKQYEFEPADLLRLVQQTVQLMAPYAAEKQVQLDLPPPPPATAGRLAEITLDGRAIQQALVNLIDNAIKHSPPGETVTVSLAVETPPPPGAAPEATSSQQLSPPTTVLVSVADRGPGIPPAEHERIFERFYRRGSELRRETQGVGIGLSIVRHVAEAHGGRVSVSSQLGQGSRFTLVLPAKEWKAVE